MQDGVANDSQNIIQARARLELRETATSRDAQDVVEIFKHRYRCIIVEYIWLYCYNLLFVCSLYDAYSDELGVVDFGRSQNGSGMTSQSQVL